MRDFEVRIVIQADSADEAVNKAMIMGPDITFAYVTDSADASGEETLHKIKNRQEYAATSPYSHFHGKIE